MAKSEMTVLTNMCMVCDDEGRVLVQDRRNPNWPGMTFPGGHVESGESFTGSVIREVKEETGLDIEAPRLCGVKQFQTLDGVRYIVFLYKADYWSGTLRSSEEGEVFWLAPEEFARYTWVPDFEDMLTVFREDSVDELYYTRRDGHLMREFFGANGTPREEK